MKNVIIRNSKRALLLVFILSLCASCLASGGVEKPDSKNENIYFYLDVLGDSQVDTLFLRNNYADDTYVDIVLLQCGKEEKILTVKPRLYSLRECVTTIPQIEIIRLESNYTQSDDKELRIIIRNTEIVPDYIFVDLKYESQWVVKRYYVCNSNTDESVSISVIAINRSVSSEFGKEPLLDQGQILNLFSNE